MVEQKMPMNEEQFEALLWEIELDEIREQYEKALESVEKLIAECETVSECLNDEEIEYHYFSEFLQEVLFEHWFKPTKETKNVQLDFASMYCRYGSILMEMNRPEDAAEAFKKAMEWNPVDVEPMFGYAETLKTRGMMEEYYSITRKMHNIIYQRSDLGRYYENLGAYFDWKKDYWIASCCYLAGLYADYDSPVVNGSKKDCLRQNLDQKDEYPSLETIQKCFIANNIPLGPHEDVLQLLQIYGKRFMERENWEGAVYCFETLYALTDDNEVLKLLETCKARAEGGNCID